MCFDHRKQLINNGETEEIRRKRKIILSIFSQVLKAVDPYNAVKNYIENNTLDVKDNKFNVSDFKKVYVVGFGKGSIGMTQAICDHISISEGITITNESDRVVSHSNVETIVGGHPLPNTQSIKGAKNVQHLLSKCHPDDLVIILISGGGSALLSSPRISLSDLQQTTKVLLGCGASIQEINTIRKHLSTVKGGQLVKMLPCKVITYIVSDVVGDPFEFIASGPTVGDSTAFSDAYQILKKYELDDQIPNSVWHVIDQGKKGLIPETPAPHDPVFNHVFNQIVANNVLACDTAFTYAKKNGFNPVILSTELTGEARMIAPKLFEKAKRLYEKGNGNMFISGGEPTVTLNGNGKGGRNQEFVLSLVPLVDKTNCVIGSFGTDGIDGMSPAAGAVADGYTMKRANKKSLDVDLYLKNNDSFSFFHALQDDVITGPTGTNVMDVQITIF